MKKLLILSFAVFFLSASFASSNVVIKPSLKASEVFVPIGNTGKKISLMDLSRISIKEVQEFTGQKMSMADRVAFKAAQRQLRNNIRVDGTIDSKRIAKQAKKMDGESGFHLGGFALGFLVGLIGVLIAYLINDDKKRNRVKWAWIGVATWLVIWLLLVIAIL